MTKIYLPITITSEKCPTLYDKDTIRVYDDQPSLIGNHSYTEYFINSHYISRTGSSNFNLITDVPTCMDYQDFTTAFYYRNDFDSILLIFFLMLFIVYFIFGKILHAFFIGFKH